MTTNTSVDRIGAIAEEMVQAAVESLAAVTGLAVAGGSATMSETFDATALNGAAVARSMLHGGASPGGHEWGHRAPTACPTRARDSHRADISRTRMRGNPPRSPGTR